MKTNLLGGASAAVLAMFLASSAMAQDEVKENATSVVGLNSTGDVVGAGETAIDDGAFALTGNAVGQDGDHNAHAHASSTAVVVESDSDVDALAVDGSTAVDDGGFVGGNGAALGRDANDNAAVGGDGVAVSADGEALDDGSALQYGDNNQAATSNNGAAANNSSVAMVADGDEIADEGSSVVIGDNNRTASSEDGGAALAGDGTAIGIHDVHIGGEQQVGGEDPTLAFGDDNVVASAHLDGNVSGVALAYYGDNGANGDATTVTTGSIFNNTTESMTGANRVAYNTGIANQGRSLAVAAGAAFNGTVNGNAR